MVSTVYIPVFTILDESFSNAVAATTTDKQDAKRNTALQTFVSRKASATEAARSYFLKHTNGESNLL